MALVSYGSSGESDLSGNEEEATENIYQANSDTVMSKNPSENKHQKESLSVNVISDEEDISPENPSANIDDSIFNDKEVTGSNSSSSLFASLPALPKVGTKQNINRNESSQQHIDLNEDMNTIPKSKVYEGATLEIKPKRKDSTSIKSNGNIQKNLSKRAPVRIMAPSLLKDHDIEQNGPPRKVFAASKSSGLLGLLPKPKNTSIAAPAKSQNTATKLNNDKVPGNIPAANINKQAFVPRSVSRKPTPSSASHRNKSNDSSDDSDSEPSSFFTLDDKPIESNVAPSVNSIAGVQKDQPPTYNSVQLKPYDTSPVGLSDDAAAQNNFIQQINYDSEAIAPYPPVGPSRSQETDLMDNTEALERLAGRVRKGRGGQNKIGGMESISDNIIEVNQGDLTADPREWLTKTLTQDDEAPGPRCNIGGTTKRKHQITYLAAMAKQNENELKKQWAENSQSRRAHQSKYGF